jgi:hypothetical protein
MPDLTTIERTLQTLFTTTAHRLARQTGLVQRDSKLTGPLILLILVGGFIQHPTASYNILAQVAADYGVSVTRQAIQARLTPSAVAFFQHLLDYSLSLLQTQTGLPLPLLTRFTGVYLLDSTQLALPTALAAEFPGAGGDGPAAGLKLHLLWELLRGTWQELLGGPAKVNDQLYQGHLDALPAGSLALFDLGYVALARLRRFIAQGVYFICRWNSRFVAFTPSGQPFDLGGYLARSQTDGVELDLHVGGRVRVPLRVSAARVPQAVREQRRRRAHATERKRGTRYSQAYLALLDWNIYVTNVPVAWLSGEQVRTVYRARWQVERLFKLWKSQGALAAVAGQGRGRVLCEIYAKLVGLAVFGYLTAPVRMTGAGELSAARAWVVGQRQIGAWGQALQRGRGVREVLRQLYVRWGQFGCKEHRADRPTTLELLNAPGLRAHPRSAPAWVA